MNNNKFFLDNKEYIGSKLEFYENDTIETNQILFEFDIYYSDSLYQEKLAETILVIKKELDNIHTINKVKNQIKPLRIYDIDLGKIINYCPPTIYVNNENSFFHVVYFQPYKIIENGLGEHIGSKCILKLEKTNELLSELYKSKSIGEDEGMAKLHYITERFVGYLSKAPSTNFMSNLDLVNIDNLEKDLLKNIKKITGIFAHGNTTTLAEKEKFLNYYDGFYKILFNLINKYIQ